MSLPIPKVIPDLGFYYHYKHNSNESVNNYSYEVIGVGFHTEYDTHPNEQHFIIYRPLYDTSIYTVSKKLGIPCFYNRPLDMWMEDVEKDGKKFSRFHKIIDPEVISKLEKIRKEMY